MGEAQAQQSKWEVPNLPGFSTAQPESKPRPQSLQVVNGVRVARPTPMTAQDAQQQTSSAHTLRTTSATASATPRNEPSSMRDTVVGDGSVRKPAWLEYSDCTAQFDAYFVERLADVHDAPDYRVRRLKVAVYLEDNTVAAVEPKHTNSGVDEGKFLRRQRVQRIGSQFGEHLTYKDFIVGRVITLQGKDVVISGCRDDFTREFYRREGIEQPPPIEVPPDPAVQHAQAGLVNTIGKSNLPYRVKGSGHRKAQAQEAMRRLVQYLEYDRHVLRFYAIHDGTSKEFGTKEPYVVHYFLADDTVEILQVKENSDGKDPFPKLLSRRQLPKQYNGSSISPLPEDARFPQEPHVHWNDLHIGGTFRVYNLELRLLDCDDFTRAFLKREGRRNEQELQPIEPEDDRPNVRSETDELPPHNGFGSAKDAAENCKSIRPKRTELVPKERYDTNARLKLYARIVAVGGYKPSEVNASRAFVVFVYEGDASVEIHELPRPNDGIKGKRFLERTREPLQGKSKQEYTIGAEFEASGYTFIISGADERTLQSMQQRTSEFPESETNRVQQKAKACKHALQSALHAHDTQPVDAFTLAQLSNGGLTPHEATNLLRSNGLSTGDGESVTAKPADILNILS